MATKKTAAGATGAKSVKKTAAKKSIGASAKKAATARPKAAKPKTPARAAKPKIAANTAKPKTPAKAARKKTAAKKGASLAKGKDPRGGLTAEGRRYYKETEGLNLRPGVRGRADTPEKMVRKGSFLRRHFANPPGPVKDAEGKPTRQALQAAAWGEPVPKNEADEKKLAEKGSELLEKYHAARDGEKKRGARKPARL